LRIFADAILIQDNIKFLDIDEDSVQGKLFLEAINVNTINQLGYFLKPSELFSSLVKKEIIKLKGLIIS